MDKIEKSRVSSWCATSNAASVVTGRLRWWSSLCLKYTVIGSEAEHQEIPLIRTEKAGGKYKKYQVRQDTQSTIYASLSRVPASGIRQDDNSRVNSTDCPQERQSRNANRTENRLYQLNTQLLDAIVKREIEDVSRFLAQGANPNATCQLSNVSASHLAALKDNDALSLLIKSGAESFRTDNCGRLPLHLAAWAGNTKHVVLLLNISEEASCGVGEITSMARTHIDTPCKAESQHNVDKTWKDSMEHNCMKTNERVPVIQPGWTALHSASARAQVSCVQLLLTAGADPFVRDDAGRTALDVLGEAYYSGFKIHVNNFRDTIKILLLKIGGKITNTKYLNNVNTPLHTAVQLESKEAIEDLLNAGASATCLNSDGLTPMHICVEKRLKEHLQLLANFENSYLDLNVAVVDIKDVKGQTVLHAAVRAGWTPGVRIALGAGASISVKANDGETPLHIAAAMVETDILRMILTVSNDVKYHIDVINQKENTALFVATINNNLEAVKLLIKHGASTRVDEPQRLNILHVAAEHGHTGLLYFLLDYDGCDIASLVNDISQKDRYSPIIYAVVNNHPECVKLLLQKGAKIDLAVPRKDKILNDEEWTTALHIAATENCYEIARILINFDKESMNKPNSSTLLPFHQACLYGNRDIISLFIHEGADLSTKHPKLKTPIGILMEQLPQATAFMEGIFDSYITSQGSMLDRDYAVTVSYKILLPDPSDDKHMKVIKALIASRSSNGHRKLLQHPFIESFLFFEWSSLLPFFYMLLALYGLFCLSLNVYIVSIFFYQDKNKLNITNETEFVDNLYPNKPVPIFFRSDVWKYMIYITVSLLAIQEIILIRIKTKRYFLNLETWVKFWAMALSMFLPSVVSWRDAETVRDSPYSPEWVRLIATVAVLLTWLESLFLISRYPSWGFYALMFGKVTSKVFKVLLTFAVLIIGACLCFMIQFRAQPPFEGWWASFTKTLVMMTSEFDYTSTINKQSAHDLEASIILLRVIFIVFIVFASIVFMNLMIGVAVNDVNSLERIASIKRLQKQVDFLTLFEGVACHKVIRRMLRKQKNLNERYAINLKPRDPKCIYNKILPKRIKNALYEKAQMKQTANEFGPMAFRKTLDEMMHAIIRQDDKLDQIHKSADSIELMSKSIETLHEDVVSLKQLLQSIVQQVNH